MLLVGDATMIYPNVRVAPEGEVEGVQFTAAHTGVIDELWLLAASTASTATSVILGIFAEGAGVSESPGLLLGAGEAVGVPGTDEWVKVTGLSIPVTRGQTYWLAYLPVGGTVSVTYAVSADGTRLGHSGEGGATELATPGAWEVEAEGPLAFQALGAATPGKRVLTALGIEMRDSMPPILRESPDYLGVIHALAKECERARAALEIVRAQFNPATATVLLGVWERMTRQTVAPVGKSEAERQALVTARLRKMLSLGEGSSWEEQVTLLLGPGWLYEENIPGDMSTPAEGVLRITLPFSPEDPRYAAAPAQLREITPAHLELEFASEAGFVLDESELDRDEMTI